MDGPARAAIQHIADKQKAYQAALGVYLEFRRDVQEGRLNSEVLEEWSKVEKAAGEVADARQEYEEILAKE